MADLGNTSTFGSGATTTEQEASQNAALELLSIPSSYYYSPSRVIRKAGDNSVIQIATDTLLDVVGMACRTVELTELDVDASGDWDTTTGTDYTVAANRAGKDFYVYACQPSIGTSTTGIRGFSFLGNWISHQTRNVVNHGVCLQNSFPLYGTIDRNVAGWATKYLVKNENNNNQCIYGPGNVIDDRDYGIDCNDWTGFKYAVDQNGVWQAGAPG